MRETVLFRFQEHYNENLVPITYALSGNEDGKFSIFIGQQTVEEIAEFNDLDFKTAYKLFWTYYYLTDNTSEMECEFSDDKETVKLFDQKLKERDLSNFVKKDKSFELKPPSRELKEFLSKI